MSRGFMVAQSEEVWVVVVEGYFEIEVARWVRAITEGDGAVKTAYELKIPGDGG
jgi:hypothetical protein